MRAVCRGWAHISMSFGPNHPCAHSAASTVIIVIITDYACAQGITKTRPKQRKRSTTTGGCTLVSGVTSRIPFQACRRHYSTATPCLICCCVHHQPPMLTPTLTQTLTLYHALNGWMCRRHRVVGRPGQPARHRQEEEHLQAQPGALPVQHRQLMCSSCSTYFTPVLCSCAHSCICTIRGLHCCCFCRANTWRRRRSKTCTPRARSWRSASCTVTACMQCE